MTKTTTASLTLAVAFAAASARGGVARFELGEQDFADGASPILESDNVAGGAGEPFPFDGTIFGTDAGDVLGSFSYLHTFEPAGNVTAANLTIGLLDHDSPPTLPVDTIDVFFNGVQQPDEVFVGASSYTPLLPSSATVVTMPVPLELLADGSLEVRVTATRAGSDPRFTGNSIHPDFSTLTVQTVNAIPLPPALWMAGVTMVGAGLATVRRRRFALTAR